MDISRQQVADLVNKVLESAPGIEQTGTQVDVIVSEVLEQTLQVINSLEAAAQEGFGAPVCVAIMVQGACAAVLDGMPPENVRMQLYRAGRAVGRFISDRFAENIRHKLQGDA